MFKIDRAVIEIMPLSMFEDVVAQCSDLGLNIVNLDGSGEATLNRNLPKYIEIVKKYNAKAFIFSNGHRMEGKFMMDCVDAGLDFYRFSWVGYDVKAYDKWMYNRIGGSFMNTWDKVKAMREYVIDTKSDCVVATYHLITDNDNEAFELKHYKKIVEQLDVKTEIWRMHNWSGVTDISETGVRTGVKKTCGRPFSPDVVIRAGGLDGQSGAVHPCCQVLGRDEEAVLGHTSKNTIEEIWEGEAYSGLRDAHRSGDYPGYCNDCDFLVDDPEVLVYTNHERDLMKMHGTEFDLNDYR